MKEKLTLENLITKLCLLLEQNDLFNRLTWVDKRRFLKRYTFCINKDKKPIFIYFYDGSSSDYRLCASIQKETALNLYRTFSYSYLYLNEKRELFKIINDSDYAEINPVNKTIYLMNNYWFD